MVIQMWYLNLLMFSSIEAKLSSFLMSDIGVESDERGLITKYCPIYEGLVITIYPR